MRKQIIQFLLENQGYVSVATICTALRQPLSAVAAEVQNLETEFPGLLQLKLSYHMEEMASVKIADYQDDLARRLL